MVKPKRRKKPVVKMDAIGGRKRHVVALFPETVKRIEKFMEPRETYSAAFSRAVTAMEVLAREGEL